MANENDKNTLDSDIANQFLTFEVDKMICGIEIGYVKEIIPICKITKVPKTEKYVKGIINLRGDIIPVINIRERFRKEAIAYDELTCIIIVMYKDYILGFIVDKVDEVVFINKENLIFPPNDKQDYHNKFIKSIGKTSEYDLKLILDLDKLVVTEVDRVSNAQ